MSSQNSYLPSTHLAPYIEQVQGTDKGKVFELSGDQITIGRADGNDIVVQSEAISRCHAHLVKADDGWFIRDNQSKNGIQVNGEKVAESWLQNGDIVQVGDFTFKFNLPAPAGSPGMESGFGAMGMDPAPVAGMDSIGMGVGAGAESTIGLPAAAPKKKGLNKRVLLYGGLGLVLALVLMTGGEEGTKTPDGESEEAVATGSPAQQAIGNLEKKMTVSEPPGNLPNMEYDPTKSKPKKIVGLEDPLLTKAEQAMKSLDWSNKALKESQAFFKKGQREYWAGNLHRSIDYFRTALDLYRGHILAERYLKKAVYASELKAKENMAMGIRYFNSLQYQRAKFHFNEAIALMQHRTNEPITQEAKRYIEQSDLRLKAAELFP